MNFNTQLLFAFLVTFVLMPKALGLVEVSGNFSYKKQVYGDARQNKLVERSYETSLAFYLFKYTGLEFSYSYERDVTTENDHVEDSSSGISILRKESTLNTRTYGVGLRQALTSPRGSFVPSIAIGYAYQVESGGVSYLLKYNTDELLLYFPYAKSKSDALFGVFSLKIKLTKFFSINGSVKTVFDAFEWNEAKDDLRYQAGFSWYF